jgi:hypothetical protein
VGHPRLGLGLVAGLVLGGIGEHESLTVSVTDERVSLAGHGRVAEHEHADVATVFVDRKQLVLLGADTAALDRRPCELDHERVAAEVRELRDELARTGVLVRADKRERYWRLAHREDG